jgi:hypothetical protein
MVSVSMFTAVVATTIEVAGVQAVTRDFETGVKYWVLAPVPPKVILVPPNVSET